MKAMISILGMYNIRPDIFDDMQLPEGVELDTLLTNLLSELAEVEILYPEPDILKTIIGLWSARRLSIWTRLYNTTQIEYNPIYNKDAYYTETENRNLSGNDREERDLASTARGNGTDNTVHNVYGYNTSQAAAAHSDDETQVYNNTGTNTGSVDVDRKEAEEIARTRREYGNIGVTTTQQMIEAERKVAEFDIYGYIIDEFKNRFCILVY